MAFVPEKEANAALELGRPVTFFCTRREHPNPLQRRSHPGGQKGIPVVVKMQIQRLPIIHPAAFQVAVRDREAKGPDEMKPDIRVGAKTPDVSRVLRDFRVKQDDMTPRLLHTECAFAQSFWRSRIIR